MPVHERLGSLSKEGRDVTSPPFHEEPVPCDTGDFIQRCVIIQRDEKGYGLTVSGDNPVFVQSVKENGAAARAGVQQGDKIIKVNGTLVTNSNHREVVKLIKSGSYVALTLHGKPSGHKGAERVSERITGPQPVDAEKEREFESQKILTTKLMLKQAIDDYDRIRREYLHHPNERLQVQLAEAQKTIEVIKKQLELLTGQEGKQEPANTSTQLSSPSTGSSTTSQSPDYSSHADNAFLSPTANHSSNFQIVYAPVPWGGSRGGFHQKSPSMPETFYSTEEARDASVMRSHSDVTRSTSNQLFTSTYEPTKEETVAQQKVTATSLPTTMSVSELQTTSSFDSQSAQSDTNEDLIHDSGSEPSLRMPDPNTAIEHGKLQMVSPHQVNIISMEDDEFTSEEEQFYARSSDQSFGILGTLESQPYVLHQAIDDHGPFSDLSVLKTKPAHLAVFIHYLISNSYDPSALLFYLVSENYGSGSQKEMRKWAYEIYSTFLLKEAPLTVSVEDSVVTDIDDVLVNKYDKEDVLRNVFESARTQVLDTVNELLADFRNKRALGLSQFYGDQVLQDDNMDKTTELRHTENVLAQDWQTLVTDNRDRSQAMASALATFLKNLGITRIGNVNLLDRCSSFNTRDKRIFKIKSNKKVFTHKGHNFAASHYYSTVYCANCHKALWGIGNQGYQCINCEVSLHKNCLEKFEDLCGKKNKKDRRSVLGFDRIRKPSTPNPAAIEKAKQLHGHDDSDPLLSPKTPSVFQMQPPVTEVNENETAPPREPQTTTAGGSSWVGKLVDRYQGMSSNTDHKSPPPSPRSRSPEGTRAIKKEALSRSGSLKNEPRLGTKVNRRAKSDVNVDEETIKALSGESNNDSSSASSLSNKSADSPSNSTEKLEQTVAPSRPAFSSRFIADSDLEVEPEMPTLDKQLPKDVLKKLKPKEKKRQEVINELFFTEKTHLRNLKILDQLFYKPMMVDSFVSDSLVRTVFPNLEEVIKVHKTLNESMKKRHKESPVVPQVADLLLNRFEGSAGDTFKRECAMFIRNQSYALELLKVRQRKEPKLAQLLADAESNQLCRRLQLKDLIPTEFHRLTKYPLLIENLMKYTSVNTPEHASLSQALKLSKEILQHVNQALKECENQNKLQELQRKLDKKSLENLTEYKSLDLTQHKLLFNGDLTWRLNKNKLIDVHVALLEDLLVILQRQDDKYVLKSQSMTVVADTKFTHSPIIKLPSIFLRINASDKRAFFLVSTSGVGPQIYDLVAVSCELRKAWFRNISDAVSEAQKSNSGRRNARVVTVEQERNTSEEKDKGNNVEFENVDEAVLVEAAGIIQPKEVVVSSPAYTQSEHISSAIDFIKQKDGEIKSALEEKHKMIAKMMNIPAEDFETVAEMSGEVDGEKEPRDLVLASIYQLDRLTSLIKESTHLQTAQAVSVPKDEKRQQVAADKIVPITSCLQDYLSQLLGLLSMKETEQAGTSLKVVPPSPDRPSSYISVGDSSEGSGMIDETDQGPKPAEDSSKPALLFGFTPEPVEPPLSSKVAQHDRPGQEAVGDSHLTSTPIAHLVTADAGIGLPVSVEDSNELRHHQPVHIHQPLQVNDSIRETVDICEPAEVTTLHDFEPDQLEGDNSDSSLNMLEAVTQLAEVGNSEAVQYETVDSDSETPDIGQALLCVTEPVCSESDQDDGCVIPDHQVEQLSGEEISSESYQVEQLSAGDAAGESCGYQMDLSVSADLTKSFAEHEDQYSGVDQAEMSDYDNAEDLARPPFTGEREVDDGNTDLTTQTRDSRIEETDQGVVVEEESSQSQTVPDLALINPGEFPDVFEGEELHIKEDMVDIAETDGVHDDDKRNSDRHVDMGDSGQQKESTSSSDDEFIDTQEPVDDALI